MKNINIDGKKFGRLLTIERVDDYISNNHRPRQKYKCLCDCGNIVEVLKENLTGGKTKSCGCFRKDVVLEGCWTGYGEISGKTFCSIKAMARVRNIEYNVSKEFLWELFLKQKKKCALTGQDIAFIKDYKSETLFQTASLDRIDSSKGYVEGNVWWVHKDINRLKLDWTLEELYRLCESVVTYKKSSEIIAKSILS